MAAPTDGARVINLGDVRVAPESSGSAGTYVDISPFVQVCRLPVSIPAGDITGANDTASRMVSGQRATYGPLELTLFKSPLAGKVDALFTGFLAALADSDGAFYVRGIESTDTTAAATNPVHEIRCVGIDGWELLSIDTGRSDGATVSLSLAVDGAPDTATS